MHPLISIHSIIFHSIFKIRAIISRSSYLDFTGEKSAFPGSPKIRHSDIEREGYTLEDKETKRLGPFSVTHVSQDHSVPGASSFVVETDGKKILYTGDIRFHGTNPMTIDEYVKKVGSGVDLMLCEGTRVDSEITLSELDIIEKISEKIKSTKGLVFVDFGWKDTTRYETIKKAAETAGRTFVINARMAYLLNKLGNYPPDDNVRVFMKRKGSCLYSPADYVTQKHEYGLSVDWKSYIDSTHYDTALVADDIKKHPEKYVMMLSYFDLNQIFDLSDDNGQIPDSWLIKAQCAPFCDEMELDEERFINWLETFGVGFDLGETPIPDGCKNTSCSKLRKRIDRSHVSGHVSRPEIKELIEKITPKKVVPVHTENPQSFVEIVDEIGAGIDIIVPEYGNSYKL